MFYLCVKLFEVMEELFYAIITEDGSVQVMTDFESPEAASGKRAVIDRGSFLFQSLVSALRDTRPECLYVIQLLEAARREARYDCAHLHPELEAALSRWRRMKADSLGYSPFVVLHQGVLLKIADAAPQTTEELLAVPGFSQGKMEKYGEEILAVTRTVNPA
jgi:superfamily II DNA helicase RecQ